MSVRMKTLGVVMIAGFALAACGTVDAVQETVETVSVSAKLAQGVPTPKTPAFHYTVKGGVQPFSGVVDGPNQATTAAFADKDPDGFTMSMTFLVVGSDSWTKISFSGAPAGADLPKLPKQWMKLDKSKLPADLAGDLEFSGKSDPGYVSNLLVAAADLKETGPNAYAGTTDLTRSTEAEIVDAATLTALGEKAKTVPLEVSVDSEGRIAKAVVRIPAAGKAKAATYEVVYDRYGSAAPLTAPAGGVAAPAAVYQMFNS
ncbi:hypothetical protein [Actinoplanes utahensis]|nr:hypothetical protein [Actinoplanes utahensis]